MKVLLVEDHDRVALALSDALGRHGLQVQRASSGVDALSVFGPQFDVVILGLTLPDLDGFEVCAKLRQLSNAPIIMATARGDLPSRVRGLYLGADDYLVKPYDLRELLARVHAVVRRSAAAGAVSPPDPQRSGPLVLGRLRLDLATRTVEMDGEPVILTRKEFDRLAELCLGRDVVLRRQELLSKVWRNAGGDGRTLEVHISSLRAKLGAAHAIRTVRGVGYQLGQL